MASLSVTNFDYALKIKYPQQKVEKLFYEMCPTFALIPKDTKFVGSSQKIAMRYGAMTSISADFDIAQAAKNHSLGANFLVTRVRKYAIGGIDNETIFASKGNEGALIEASKAEMEGAIQELGKVVGDDIFGAGDGSIGSYASDDGARTLTFENAEDVRHFEPGMVLVYAASATAALGDAGATMTVQSVDRSAGTITFLSTGGTIAATWGSITTGGLIFRYGDYATASDANCVTGFAGYLPGTSTPSALFGMTRTADPTRLAGVWKNSTTDPGLTVEEVLQLLSTEVAREGGRPDIAVMGMTKYKDLVNALGSKVTYNKQTVGLRGNNGKTVADMGFDTLRVIGARGPIDVIADPACPEAKIYMLQKNTWKFSSLGMTPRPILNGGKSWVKDAHNDDGVEIRVGFYGNLICNAPGYNGVYTY